MAAVCVPSLLGSRSCLQVHQIVSRTNFAFKLHNANGYCEGFHGISACPDLWLCPPLLLWAKLQGACCAHNLLSTALTSSKIWTFQPMISRASPHLRTFCRLRVLLRLCGFVLLCRLVKSLRQYPMLHLIPFCSSSHCLKLPYVYEILFRIG